MTSSRSGSHHRSRLLAAVGFIAALIFLPAPATGVAQRPVVPQSIQAAHAQWRWPVAVVVSISVPYQQPEHDYGSGHRGIDLWVGDGAVAGAPAGGTIAWVGTVADRPLVTIDHGNGFVTTLEPVVASAEVGSAVEAGEIVGYVSTGGHAATGTLHWGVRQSGSYINPASLFSRIARPILLPCCEE